MDVFNRPQALIVIFGLLFICETRMAANLTSRHVSGTYSRNLYSHVEVSREIQIQLPPTWDRKNVKLIRKFSFSLGLKGGIGVLHTWFAGMQMKQAKVK